MRYEMDEFIPEEIVRSETERRRITEAKMIMASVGFIFAATILGLANEPEAAGVLAVAGSGLLASSLYLGHSDRREIKQIEIEQAEANNVLLPLKPRS